MQAGKAGLGLFASLKGARLGPDLIAGLSLAALALPEQLATARLAGVPPAQGIAVFAVAALAMLVLVRDRVLSTGADSTIAPLVAASALAVAPAPAAAMLALEVGAILSAAALLRFEWVARLLSKPVAAGMMAGIACHIFVGRLPTALGLDLPAMAMGDTLRAVAGAWREAHLAPLVMTLAVAALAALGPRSHGRVPGALLAIASATALAAWADPDAQFFPRLSAAEGGFGLAWPPFNPDLALSLLPTALSIAFLCLFQTTVVLRASRTDSAEARRNALGGVGLANLLVAAAGGFPVNASPPRTALLQTSGATSQLAGAFAAALSLALVALAPGLLAHLPEAALAGVLVYVAAHLFPLTSLRSMARRSPIETVIALFSLALVVLLPLEQGLPLAIGLSLIHASVPLFLPQVTVLHRLPGTTVWWPQPETAPRAEQAGLLVLGLTAPITFANAEGMVAEIHQAVAAHRAGLRLVVLECAGVLALDLTGADALGAALTDLRGQGLEVALARLESTRAAADMRHSGFLDHLGEGRLFPSVDVAVQALLD